VVINTCTAYTPRENEKYHVLTDHVSQQCEKTVNMIIIYVLITMFLFWIEKEKRFSDRKVAAVSMTIPSGSDTALLNKKQG